MSINSAGKRETASKTLQKQFWAQAPPGEPPGLPPGPSKNQAESSEEEGTPAPESVYLQNGGLLGPPLEVRGGLRSENSDLMENVDPLYGFATFLRFQDFQNETKSV